MNLPLSPGQLPVTFFGFIAQNTFVSYRSGREFWTFVSKVSYLLLHVSVPLCMTPNQSKHFEFQLFKKIRTKLNSKLIMRVHFSKENVLEVPKNWL